MSDTSDAIEQTAVLVREFGQLKGAFFAGLAVIVILALAIVALWLVLRHREKSREADADAAQEAMKEERAARHASALNQLSETIREHISMTTEQWSHIQRSIASFGTGLGAMEDVTKDLRHEISQIRDRQNGILTVEQSCGIAESFFFSVIVEKSFGLITLSLMHNHFETRKEFVEESVKTDVARVLYDVRAILKQLPLSIRIENFFTKVDGDGERFVYCDMLWETVLPLYRETSIAVTERVRALRYKVLNATKDYYEACRPMACASGGTTVIRKTDVHKKHPSSASIRPI